MAAKDYFSRNVLELLHDEMGEDEALQMMEGFGCLEQELGGEGEC